MEFKEANFKYIQHLYNNFVKEQIEEISNKMINSQIYFFF